MVVLGEVLIILFSFLVVGTWVTVVSYRGIDVCFAAIVGVVVGQRPDCCG